MIMKFLSNSPVTHISANTHPAVPIPAVITITCNYNFAVNKWNHTAGSAQLLKCSGMSLRDHFFLPVCLQSLFMFSETSINSLTCVVKVG